MISTLNDYTYRYRYDTPKGPWVWSVRVDVSGPSPLYYVQDIITPWGVLTDRVPIPGEVITSMASSINTIQTQFKPQILVTPTSFIFTTTEGLGFGTPQTLSVTNGGVFGSLLNVAITTSATNIVAQPSTLGNLGSSETGTTTVSVSGETLLAANSPYSYSIVVQDASAVNPVVTIPVVVNVLPKATISVTPLTLTFTVSKPLSGPFPPIPAASFTITNTGPGSSSLQYLIQKLLGHSSWLVSYGPPTGVLPGSGSQLITVIAQPEDCYLSGVYSETLRISGYSTNNYVDVTVTLNIV